MVIILAFPHCLNCNAYPFVAVPSTTPSSAIAYTSIYVPSRWRAALMFGSYCHHIAYVADGDGDEDGGAHAALLMMAPTMDLQQLPVVECSIYNGLRLWGNRFKHKRTNAHINATNTWILEIEWNTRARTPLNMQ
ncbi:unnamed protein product [Ceratitis capitata]|uniref:(Mediterranean fruit fly) hypothetical protein n=1 Tax=Ceratitis capitata TaxID=7213 RepID=A0A811V4H9_CERCA|nr:unnamed protein product [Ceratitis capitata]